MNVQVSQTPDGFPRVTWEQSVPTGETALSLNRKRKTRRALLGGILILAFMAGAGASLTTIFIVMLIYAALASKYAGRRGVKFRILDMVITRYPDEGLHVAHNTAIREHRSETCVAELRADHAARTLRFVAYRRDPPPQKTYTDVPLLSFHSLQVSTDLQWFTPAGRRDHARVIGAPETPVIMAHPEGHPPILIARAANSPAEFGYLHQILSREFVDNRPALMAKADTRFPP